MRRHLPVLVMLCFLADGCGSDTLTTTTGDNTGSTGGNSGTSGDTDPLAPYYISFALCGAGGPDCAHLHLGDPDLTTTTPTRGKLYACTGYNPSAPGSNASRITWIDNAAGTWNLLKKPFLPSGTFAPTSGVFSLTEQASTRTITVNDLPVDAMIGDWPMTKYAALTAIDGNPGVPAAHSYTFALPLNPEVAATPSCVGLGAIGVTLNGVILYDAVDARGDDAVAHEIVDAFGGHPAQTDYHYHFLPERLDDHALADGHSGIVGYIRDGFPIYGYKGENGKILTNDDLDECHGHSHGTLGYHYHATLAYPYLIGCYRGTPN